jgi:hypothetical protein
MAQLHELLAAEKTPTAAYNKVAEETLKKFAAPEHYFTGHTKSLSMIEKTPENEVVEANGKEDKPVVTNVPETLAYMLDLFAKAEDVQHQKNLTNQVAKADVILDGEPVLTGVPVDTLLGLEARLSKLKSVFEAMPTLDSSRQWTGTGGGYWETVAPEHGTKTEKRIIPIVMSAATDKHPAQIQAVTKDVIVGQVTIQRRSGAATALQKANAIKRVDDLMVAVKKARMRANETLVVNGEIGAVLAKLLAEPLAE